MKTHLHMWRFREVDWNGGLPVSRWDCRCGEKTWTLPGADLPDLGWYAFVAAISITFLVFVTCIAFIVF